MNTTRTLIALVALLLAACGGGDEEPLNCIGGVVYDASGTPKAAAQAGQVTRLETC